MKQKSPAKLKAELDKVFSLFVRLRDSKDGYGNCYSCGKYIHYKDAHCGHFIPRNILITRWNENNCKLQCVGCNLYGNGKPLDFEEHLKRDLGEEFVEKMKASRHQMVKLDRAWYEERIQFYKSEVEKLSTV